MARAESINHLVGDKIWINGEQKQSFKKTNNDLNESRFEGWRMLFFRSLHISDYENTNKTGWTIQKLHICNVFSVFFVNVSKSTNQASYFNPKIKRKNK